MQQMLNDETRIKRWFGCFATRLDQQAEQDMPLPLTDEEAGERSLFIAQLNDCTGLERDPTCRMAYQEQDLQLFVNGCEWDIDGVSSELVKYVANHRWLSIDKLQLFLSDVDNQIFLYELWRLQWLQWSED